MADHFAEQILDAVVTTLTGLTTTGSNVQRARVYSFADTVTDALSIYMGSDVPVDASVNNIKYLDSELTFEVHIYTANASPEQQINLIKKEVIAALKADDTLGLSFTRAVEELGWSKPELDGDRDTRAGMCVGEFAIEYRRDYDDPSTLTP